MSPKATKFELAESPKSQTGGSLSFTRSKQESPLYKVQGHGVGDKKRQASPTGVQVGTGSSAPSQPGKSSKEKTRKKFGTKEEYKPQRTSTHKDLSRSN